MAFGIHALLVSEIVALLCIGYRFICRARASQAAERQSGSGSLYWHLYSSKGLTVIQLLATALLVPFADFRFAPQGKFIFLAVYPDPDIDGGFTIGIRFFPFWQNQQKKSLQNIHTTSFKDD